MRKWSFVLLVALAIGLIGCGGSGAGGGGTNTTTTATTGTTGRASQGVNIPSIPALFDTYYEPTQGRQNIQYFTDIGNIIYTDLDGNSTSLENSQTIVPETLNLSSPSLNPINEPLDVTVPFIGSGLPATSRNFNLLQLFFSDFYTSVNPNPTTGYQIDVPVQLSAFQGRITAVQIYLNDGMFDFTQNPPAFNQQQFQAQNADPQSGLLQGFLSDYLSVDLSSVANKPVMTNGQSGGRFFISGDNFAVARTTPTSTGTYFEVLTPFGVFPGSVYNSRTNNQGIPTKTYQLTQPNILSLTNPGNVTSLEGLWYDYSERVSAGDSTFMITFPPTGDGNVQEFVLVERTTKAVNGGTTNVFPNVYFGTVNYSAVGGPSFSAFPIGDLEPGSVAGQVSGSLTNVVDGNGLSVSMKTANWWRTVHAGKFAITKGSAVGIASSGRFVVYRV